MREELRQVFMSNDPRQILDNLNTMQMSQEEYYLCGLALLGASRIEGRDPIYIDESIRRQFGYLFVYQFGRCHTKQIQETPIFDLDAFAIIAQAKKVHKKGDWVPGEPLRKARV